MESIEEKSLLLKKIMDLLEQHFGYNCEVVLHDLTGDYEHTIVDIRNGNITGRRIGNCGSNLGLEVLRGKDVNGDRFNYITHTRDGKILRSSSLYFRNHENKVIGSLCINTDITESVRYEAYLHENNNCTFDSHQRSEVFATDVRQLLEHFLLEGQRLVDKPATQMNKDERIHFLKYLDDNGAFLITKSSERVCEFMGISKYMLYSILDRLRNNKETD